MFNVFGPQFRLVLQNKGVGPAKVETLDEKEIGAATDARIGPASLRVSFARGFVG